MVKRLVSNCAFCGDIKHNLFKLRHGIILKGLFICGQCQQDMLTTTVHQQSYSFYKDKLRRILF